MPQLKERTKGPVLLTGTPMQVHPAEVWYVLCLFVLLEEWIARRTPVPWHTIHMGPLTQVISTSIGSARPTLVHGGSRLAPVFAMVSVHSGSKARRVCRSRNRNPLSGAGRVKISQQRNVAVDQSVACVIGWAVRTRGGQSPRPGLTRRHCDVFEDSTSLDSYRIALSRRFPSAPRHPLKSKHEGSTPDRALAADCRAGN